MKEVRVLVFDDEPKELTDISFAFEDEWEKFKWTNGDPLPALRLKKVSSADEIRTIVRQQRLEKDFDLFLCDVYVGAAPSSATNTSEHRPEPEGFRFIKMAKDHGLPLCFAMTKGIWGSVESHEKALRAVAQHLDGSFLKGDLRGVHSPDVPREVLSKIANCLRNRGIIQALETKLVFGNHIEESRTLGIIDDVGSTAINAFASEVAFPGASSVSFASLSPGLSGAKVLKLTYGGGSEDFSTRPILLKVSRDKVALQNELAKFEDHIRKPGRPLARAIAQPRNAEAGAMESNGWYAISFECAAPAKSLIDWLTRDPPTEQAVHELLVGLFFDSGLSDAYRTTRKISSPILPSIQSGMLSHYRRMAISEAIVEFKPLLKKHVKGKLSHLDELELFLRSERLDGIESKDLGKRNTALCLVHGDLHGRNVLITSGQSRDKAMLIDIASMREALWSLDLVRLLCDCLLSGWDRGSNSLEWSGLKHWIGQIGLVAQNVSPLPEAPSTLADTAVKAAVEWLMAKRFEIAGLSGEPYHAAEFSLSLAVEFARASYRDRDMTAPKRAFALVVSNVLLRDSVALFSSR